MQEPLFNQSYDVNFIKDTSYSIVSAFFYVDGKPVHFADRTVVTANGQTDDLNYSPPPTGFHWNLYGSDQVTFRVRKKDITIVNTVSKSSIGDISLIMDSVLYITDTMRASYVGEPLEDGEYVAMSMNRIYDTTDLYSGIGGDFTGTQCTLDFSKTKSFHPGLSSVLMVRVKEIPLQQKDGNAGGNIRVQLTDRKIVTVK